MNPIEERKLAAKVVTRALIDLADADDRYTEALTSGQVAAFDDLRTECDEIHAFLTGRRGYREISLFWFSLLGVLPMTGEQLVDALALVRSTGGFYEC